MNIGSGSEAWPNDQQYNLEPFTLTNGQQKYFRILFFLLNHLLELLLHFISAILHCVVKFLKGFIVICNLKMLFFSPSLLIFQSLSFFISTCPSHCHLFKRCAIQKQCSYITVDSETRTHKYDKKHYIFITFICIVE
jgi:hypothetical protein